MGEVVPTVSEPADEARTLTALAFMNIITQRSVILGVVDKFKGQYPDRRYRFFDGTTAGECIDRLEALDLETAGPADIDNVLIAKHWRDLVCDACGESVERLVRIGDAPDYEARWQDLCELCLALAIGLLGSAERVAASTADDANGRTP